MRNFRSIAGLFFPFTLLLLCGAVPTQAAGNLTTSGASAAAGQNPDFDAASWIVLQCGAPGDPQNDVNPASTDMVGDTTYPPTYYAHDSAYLYFRFRVDRNPTGPNGFDQYAWVALMQVPSGDPFQHQFELSLDGKSAPDDFGNTGGGALGDTIEIWKNSPAENIDFSPMFNDPSETRLYAQRYDFSSGATVNTTPLARLRTTGDASSFGGTADYFVEFAFPIQVMIDKGVISSAADIDQSLFFVATASDANQYNKDYLDCPFLPYTMLSIAKSAAPGILPVDHTTELTYTIDVRNVGATVAKGVVIQDTALPSYMNNVSAIVFSDDATVSWSVVSTNPLEVKVPKLPLGSSVSVAITVDAQPSCSNPDFTNTATAYASNAGEVSDDAIVTIGASGSEICDGKDNDCDGLVDENGTELCTDGNACNGVEVCAGAAGCQPGTPLNCNDGNVCTDDSCNPDSGCAHTDNTASCDDGNLCTRTDTCQAGSCVGSNPVECTALDQCHDPGICNPATGACSNPSKPNGSSCDDGNLCTRIDACQAGSCVGSNPVVCVALDQCHDPGSCDPATGTCSNPDKPNGSSCNDGDLCTQTDNCQSGSCVGSSPVGCTALDQCHVAGTCDPATGACSNPDRPNGSSCDDGNLCSQTDTCQSGSCVGSNPVVCTALDQCHLPGTCDPATGNCSNPEKSNGSSCDDGNLCSQTDTCQGGSCVGANPVVCTALDQCHVPGTCNPSTGNCSNPSKPNGTSCADGNACTQTDTCQSGSCVGANPVVCTALDQCHDRGVCDPASGVCSNPDKPNGTSCNDADACTRTDTCQVGICVGANPVACTALDQCHDRGVCDPATGKCSNPSKPNGTTCTDGNGCTQTDTCQAGACVGANPVVCTPIDQCHTASCDSATGSCLNPAKANGTSCNDSNACTTKDSCQAGSCQGGPPLNCDDGNACTDDSCDPATGCVHTYNSVSCDDGNICTTFDHCEAGRCVGGPPPNCDDRNACTDDSCDPNLMPHSRGHYKRLCQGPQNGEELTQADADCVNDSATFSWVTSVADVCAVMNPATNDKCDQARTELMATLLNRCRYLLFDWQPIVGSRCSTHTTVGETIAHADQLLSTSPTDAECTHVQCECEELNTTRPQTGCKTIPNSLPCDDGNACTRNDTCWAGSCVGASPVLCPASDQCHQAGSCDPATGVCFSLPKADGTACNDGNACTLDDACRGGTCAGTPTSTCPAPDQCHESGTCDPSTGACNSATKADGTACDDGNACTLNDTCQAGACVGSIPILCASSDQCHEAGNCDPATGVCSDPAKKDGAPCTDGDPCTQSDSCQGGACVGSDPRICSPSDSCHEAGTCDRANGRCSNPAKADGAACDDGNACTKSDTCHTGSCIGASHVTCQASDQCHLAGTCNPDTGVCSNPDKPNGSSCDDGNACTRTDTCQGGTCLGSNPVTCSASDQCRVPGTCDTSTGACSNPARANGAPCSDGNACTQTDTCQAGTCVGSNPVTCSPDQCHQAGACDPGSGLCSNPPKDDGAPCSDGDACTRTDACQAGACVGSNPVTCAALDQCHEAGSCLPATGQCTNPIKPNGSTCDDGDACTRTDTCQAGSCTGSNLVLCPSLDQCHVTGTCDPGSGACTYLVKPDGTACDDGNACTSNDACQVGVCVGTRSDTCPSDQCHEAGVCDQAGLCSGVTRPDGTSCDDGNLCTTTDSCQSGVCTGSNPVTCAPHDQCHNPGTCDPASGLCSKPAKADGTACSDGNVCTTSDTCRSGACIGGPAVGCDDGNPCTTDTCDSTTGCVHQPESGVPISCGTGACRRTVEACVNGAEAGCVPGQPSPEVCNGIDDDCDGMVDEAGCAASPHSLAFYKRLCHKTSSPSGEALTRADVDCVNNSATFRWVSRVADICKVLDPKPANSKCKQAEAQFMVLLLNVCKGRLSSYQPISSTCSTMGTVGETIADCDSMLSSPTRTRSLCVKARCESVEINTGKALPK